MAFAFRNCSLLFGKVFFCFCFASPCEKRLLTVIKGKREYSSFFSPEIWISCCFWKDGSNIAAGKTGQLQKTTHFYNIFVLWCTAREKMMDLWHVWKSLIFVQKRSNGCGNHRNSVNFLTVLSIWMPATAFSRNFGIFWSLVKLDGNFSDGRKKWYIFQNLEKSVAEMLTKSKTPSGSNESLLLTLCLKTITIKLNFPISQLYY